MSISYTTVENSALLRKASSRNRKEFIRVKVNPIAFDSSPFPVDYSFPSCFLPKKYIKMADGIQNYRTRSDDVWVTSYPKAGTTWTMNIVWQLMNNLNFSAKFLTDADFFLERSMLTSEESDINVMDDQPSPRLVKSHFPAHLLPKDVWTIKPKLIYVHREAKDVAISMYHMFRNHAHIQYTGTMEDFLDAFLNDHVVYAPFYAHIHSFKQLNQLQHLLLINYEEMVANPFAHVQKISTFLEYDYTDEQLKELTEHVSFENMRKNFKSNSKYESGFK